MGHDHKEAFCLMQYECEKCSKLEIIWNSRDGVTPFVVGCNCCDGSMEHVNWGMDEYVPNHYPHKGNRVFVDTSKQITEIYIRARIGLYWNHPEIPMSERFKTKEEALKALTADTNHEGEPYIITI